MFIVLPELYEYFDLIINFIDYFLSEIPKLKYAFFLFCFVFVFCFFCFFVCFFFVFFLFLLCILNGL